ncbi:hypothetical protein ABPG75_002181 [Micractinium tetrahymenae]
MASVCAARAPVAVGPFKASSSARAGRAQRLQLVCSAAREQHAAAGDRRAVLLGLAGAVVAAPLVGAAPASAGEQYLPVSSLTILQRKAILADFQARAEAALAQELTAADAGVALRLLLNDAGTYDAATKTGGCDGSIVLPEELNRPENKGLAPFVDRLRKVKDAIDARAEQGQGPISWADTIVLAAKVALEKAWRQDKIDKAADAEKGAFLAESFGNPIFLKLGRKDATEPAPAGRALAPDASLQEMQQYFNKLGVKPNASSGPFPPKAPFWERQQFLLWPATQADPAATEAAMVAYSADYAPWKQQYDKSRTTVTRTSYEVDFGTIFAKLADLGAKFDKDAYLFPIKAIVPEKY